MSPTGSSSDVDSEYAWGWLSHRDYGSNFLTVKVEGVQFACKTVRSEFGRISRPVLSAPDEGTRQERENMNAGGRNEDDKIVEHQQDNPGTGVKFDTSDAHE